MPFSAAGIPATVPQYTVSRKGGQFMAKHQELTFTYINPNAPGVFEQQFQKILLDRLLYLSEQYRKTGARGK